MTTSGLVFCALASLLVGYIATAMRPPRASPSRKIHGASRDHYAPAEALGGADPVCQHGVVRRAMEEAALGADQVAFGGRQRDAAGVRDLLELQAADVAHGEQL